MLTVRNHEFNQRSLAESFIPQELFSLKGKLKKVDEIPSDERFPQPFLKHFFSKVGRTSIPVKTYIRMMYLKKLYSLGYESLCKEGFEMPSKSGTGDMRRNKRREEGGNLCIRRSLLFLQEKLDITCMKKLF